MPLILKLATLQQENICSAYGKDIVAAVQHAVTYSLTQKNYPANNHLQVAQDTRAERWIFKAKSPSWPNLFGSVEDHIQTCFQGSPQKSACPGGSVWSCLWKAHCTAVTGSRLCQTQTTNPFVGNNHFQY